MLTVQFILFMFRLGFVFQDQPEFKGGRKNLFSFISNSMIYPEYSKQNCLQGTVNISFKLNSQGRIFYSHVQKGFGTDLDVEALRIVRLTSGRWIVPPDYDTTTAMILPVNFALKNYNCESRSKDDLNNAIAAYHSRLDLSRAIYNYYDNKAAGKNNSRDESEIIALKNELGYNEKYIERLYKQGLRKLKQGDKESGCEDLNNVRRLGSNMSEKSIAENCR